MAGNPKQKQKLLYLAQILHEKSDEDHCLSIRAIEELLREKGVECERKSVSSDIQILRDAGMEIEHGSVPTRGYYLAERKFELPELRLLVDAVQSSPFISKMKSRELVDKLKSLTSQPQAEKICSSVYSDSRRKSDNEEILYSIYTINEAIDRKKKIRFIYHHRRLVNNIPVFDAGKDFVISPYATLWANDKYYLVGNYGKYDGLAHYRIDRMKRVTMLNEDIRPHSEVCEYTGEFDVADYAGKVFNMFSGDECVPIEMECDGNLLDSVIEYFGINIPFKQLANNRFHVRVNAVANEGFVRWVLSFAGGIEVKSPDSLVQMLRKVIFKMNMSYR